MLFLVIRILVKKSQKYVQLQFYVRNLSVNRTNCYQKRERLITKIKCYEYRSNKEKLITNKMLKILLIFDFVQHKFDNIDTVKPS